MASGNNNNRKHDYKQDNDDEEETNEFDEEIDETEDDLIENYLYLTKRCGVLKHSPTTSALNTSQQRSHPSSSIFARQFSLAIDDHPHEFERTTYGSFKSRSSLNDFNNNPFNHSESRVPPTIYYNNNDDDDDDESFSLVKLFARMKARLKHDRRYRPQSTHELLHEEDSQEWFELTKNIRPVLTKVLLPDGGYDAMMKRQTQSISHSRHNSQKKSRNQQQPILIKESDDEIQYEIDDELNTEGDQEFDEIIWNNFRKCSRGGHYRRFGVCKAVDRQQYQGQLVYVYGVANNILIDENLRASGLG